MYTKGLLPPQKLTYPLKIDGWKTIFRHSPFFGDMLIFGEFQPKGQVFRSQVCGMDFWMTRLVDPKGQPVWKMDGGKR